MIAIGCDHGGFELKQVLIDHLKEKGYEVKDFGCYNTDSVDYPTIVEPVCASITGGECELGILVCGTGIGMSIAANKCKGIRAAAVSETFSARLTRMHNNSNVICLGGRVIGPGIACDIVDQFLEAEYEGGRHQRRVDMVMALENK